MDVDGDEYLGVSLVRREGYPVYLGIVLVWFGFGIGVGSTDLIILSLLGEN